MIDIGANLTNKAFRDDLGAVLFRARGAGVRRIIVTGTSIAASRAARELAASHPGLLCATAGVHPHDAKTCDATTMEELRALAELPEVVAIGECGLDFDRDYSPRDVQLEWFEKQVELACELKMPLFLHERSAHGPLSGVLSRHTGALPRTVVHCFTGTRRELDAYLGMGLYIGITGWICDERRGLDLREAIRDLPLDRLMIETDAPWLLPRTMHPRPKGRRNEPAFLVWVRDMVAQCLGRDPDGIAAATELNATRFFGLD